MSGLVACCGVRWSTSLYSDALYVGAPETGASLDGRCGRCGKSLPAGPDIGSGQCGQPLCGKRADIEAHVLGGPVLYFCEPCAKSFAAECAETGIANRVAFRSRGPL